MAFEDLFNGINVFGAKAPSYMETLLGTNELDKLKQQSLISGLLGTAATYLAQPKNQRYGSALPYLGKAFLGGMQQSQNVYDQAAQDYMNGIKMQEMKKSMENKKKMEELAPNLFTKGTPAQYETQNIYGAAQPTLDENGQPIAPNLTPQVIDTKQVMIAPEGKPQINYDTLQKMLAVDVGSAAPYISSASTLKSLMTPSKEQLIALKEGEKLWSPTENKFVATGDEKKPEQTADIKNYLYDVSQGYDKTFNEWSKEQANFKVPRTVVNLPPQENAEKKTVGEAFGKQYATIQEAGFKSNAMINNVQRLNSLLDKVNTGKLTQVGVDIASTAQSLGFKIDPKLGDKQAAESLANEMALQLRNPAGGAGMPGALSDADREYLKSITPGLSKTPEGRRLISETMLTLAKRDQEVAKIAREYRKKNGGFDEGFYDELAAWSAANPLFKQANKTIEVKF